MSYLMAADSDIAASGCGSGCNCGPCKSGALSEWYVRETAEPAQSSARPHQMSGWYGESGLGFSRGSCTSFSPVVSFVNERSCYPKLIECTCRRRSIGFSGLAEPTTPLENALEKIKKALDLNPKDGYIKRSPARAALDAAIADVKVCLAVEVFRELRFGTGPVGRLFRHRLHPITIQQTLQILKNKVVLCFQALKLATLRNQAAPNCSSLDDETRKFCDAGRDACKLAAELDAPGAWEMCAASVRSCNDAASKSRGCK